MSFDCLAPIGQLKGGGSKPQLLLEEQRRKILGRYLLRKESPAVHLAFKTEIARLADLSAAS